MFTLVCFLFLLIQPTYTMKDSILLDNGASFHMVHDIDKLEDIYKLDPPITVRTGNGTIFLEWAGTAYFRPLSGTLPVQMKDTLYNPTTEVNLLSLGQAMNKCDFAFSGTSIQAYLKGSKTLLFDAHRNSANIFPAGTVINPGVVNSDFIGTNMEYSALMAMLSAGTRVDVTPVLLHRRLGHTGYSPC
jgi:hypothetical protein